MKKIAIICLLFSVVNIMAQSLNTKKWRKTERDSMERAQAFYDDSLRGELALPIFLELQKSHPNEPYLDYITGICALERSDVHPLALDLLQKAYEKNKKIEGIDYDLARAMHLNYKFDEALAQLEIYKTKNKKLSPKQLQNAELLANYCNNAKTLMANPIQAQIQNIGKPVNTEASEYVPIISADEETMVYTYKGDSSVGGRQNFFNERDPYGMYFEDVYITHKKNGQWERGRSIGPTINTNDHDAAVSLSADGQTLFIYKDNRSNNGDLYVSYLEGNTWSVASPLRGEVNQMLSWEGSCSMSADGRTLYFVSDRKGGFGGRDLYKAILQGDGSWGNVQNMGEKINTAFDDDAPFIHPDGRTLIFSSCGHNSMGSYDIFRTKLNISDSTWDQPENLGYPINSPDRDSYYVLSADGKHGYYASGKEDGEGLQDIYMVTPGAPGFQPVLALVKGIVTLQNKPVQAELRIEIAGKSGVYTNAKSNAELGNYLVNLPPGNNYKLFFKWGQLPEKTYEVDATSINAFTERVINVNFDTLAPIAPVVTATPKDTAKTTTPPPPTNETFTGDGKVEGLYFRVQIAAYRQPQNYSGRHLKGLGKIEKLYLNDGIYRFTIGGDFFTLPKAQFHRAKVKSAGQKDVFITAVYKGKRVYLDELYKMGLIAQRKK
jgi:hypothetical protein